MDFFQIYEEVADWCWDQVENWKSRYQDTIGKQLVRAVDSIGANLVEGDGRYAVADGLYFLTVARASARETRLWIRRAAKRRLVDEGEAQIQLSKLSSATKLLNILMSYRRKRGKFKTSESDGTANAVAEKRSEYNGQPDPFCVIEA